MSKGNYKRRPCSEETKRKISEAQKGIPRPYARNNPQLFKKGFKHTEERKEQARQRMLRNPVRYWLGKKLSIEQRKKLSKIAKGYKHWNYKSGREREINHIIRDSLDYRLWRESVFARDRFTCKKCGEQKIHKFKAHHVKNFSQYPELRFAIDNGITFCEKCHTKFHKKFGYKNNNWEQLKEFLCH